MKKKPVTCPHCGRRVFDAKKNVNVKTKVMTLYKKSVNKESWEPDFYIKCWKCQSIVGYKKIDN